MTELGALTWNLFHGRDHPPDPRLRTWRSRLLRITETNATHAGVNRDLRDEFISVLCGSEWQIALLQECPPRWHAALAAACDASSHGVLTSRNSLAPLRNALARLNPDLLASNEGGSNLTLIRGGAVEDRRELVLRTGPLPERRVMALTRISIERRELCVANLHASAGRVGLAEVDVMRAATAAVEWAGATPLLFGGDLNVRPAQSSLFERLDAELGLSRPTGPHVLDHLLVRGFLVREPPAPWPAARREVPVGTRAIRLSDHAPVAATFAFTCASPATTVR